jgi:hypothetical protein
VTAVPLLVFLLQPASLLVGSHHSHFEITGRQDVKDTVRLAIAPVYASPLSGKLIDRRFYQETATELASLHGSRHGADVGMLRETNGPEEAGLGVANLNQHIVNDSFSITRNHAANCEIAHEANAVQKVIIEVYSRLGRAACIVASDQYYLFSRKGRYAPCCRGSLG